MRFVLFLVTITLGIAGQFTTSIGDTYAFTISAITTDAAGNTYVVGSRQLCGIVVPVVLISSGPIPSGPAPSCSDVFVAKLDPNGKTLFTDIFSGKGVDTGTAIAVDPSGNIYVAGTTTSDDFPLSKPLMSQPSSYGAGFIVKLTNDGSTILYSTYFGGTLGATAINSLATDANGNLYLTGSTDASDFPRTSGMPSGNVTIAPIQITGAIVASISAAGDRILYSGILVAAGPTCTNLLFCSQTPNTSTGVGIALDASANAYVAGNTNFTGLPVTTGVLTPNGIGAFVAKINPGGAGLSYITYLSAGESILAPGSSAFVASETLNAIAVDAAGNAYLAGSSTGAFPTTPGSLQPAFAPGVPGNTNAFLGKLNPAGSAMVWATYLGGTPQDSAQSISIDPSGNVWASGTTESSAFPNANGWTTGPEFLIGLNAAGSKLTYSALFPSGTVAQSVALDPSGLVHVAGSSGFVFAIAPTTAPGMKIFDFQNVFGGNVTARISPAEVISIYGPGIGSATAATAVPTGGSYPTTLAGVQVAINGVDMPLLYVSANQINAVVPMGIAPNAAVTVHVVNEANVSPDYPVWIASSEPQAFPTVLNQDGTINSQTNPAKGGSIVTFYATGWQSNFAPLADGQIATTAQNTCVSMATLFTACPVTPVPGVYAPAATVLYGGAAPGIVAGVTQFNLQIGAVAASNFAFEFSFSITGPASVAQTVWIAY